MALTIQRIEHKDFGVHIQVEGSADGNVYMDYRHPCPGIGDVNLHMAPEEAIQIASALLAAALAVKQHQAEVPK